jgi:hypothetical protein
MTSGPVAGGDDPRARVVTMGGGEDATLRSGSDVVEAGEADVAHAELNGRVWNEHVELDGKLSDGFSGGRAAPARRRPGQLTAQVRRRSCRTTPTFPRAWLAG